MYMYVATFLPPPLSPTTTPWQSYPCKVKAWYKCNSVQVQFDLNHDIRVRQCLHIIEKI